MFPYNSIILLVNVWISLCTHTKVRCIFGFARKQCAYMRFIFSRHGPEWFDGHVIQRTLQNHDGYPCSVGVAQVIASGTCSGRGFKGPSYYYHLPHCYSNLPRRWHYFCCICPPWYTINGNKFILCMCIRCTTKICFCCEYILC